MFLPLISNHWLDLNLTIYFNISQTLKCTMKLMLGTTSFKEAGKKQSKFKIKQILIMINLTKKKKIMPHLNLFN